mmetsp:Transcript_8137/g.24314  ORF Transcript_8137/g.24314 Transcript_8137/m.24314 type:complete len:281 (-) Transcript_8137:458-1300(-)
MTTTAAEEKKNGYLLDRIGGEPALEAAVDEFYSRVVSDATLGHFFDGITIEQLKEHQRKFLRMAFTRIPESIDVVKFMHSKHERLFLRGLNAEHFDTVAGHFVGTLEALGVGPSEIDEAVGVVGPLRPIFEEGAAWANKHAEEEKKEETEDKTLFDRLGGEGAITAAVDEFYARVVVDNDLERFFVGVPLDVLKEHQRKFMKMAFTSVPEDVDVEKYMFTKHYRFFAMGLNESHFDKVAGHFVSTLQHLEVSQNLIDEAVGNIAPLRPVFEKGIKGRGKK